MSRVETELRLRLATSGDLDLGGRDQPEADEPDADGAETDAALFDTELEAFSPRRRRGMPRREPPVEVPLGPRGRAKLRGPSG